MRLKRYLPGLAAAGALALGACRDLDVENPNAPDAKRALSDPAAVEAVAGGAMRNWFNAYTSLRGAGVLATQARSYSSSWNNGNLNFYSSVDNPSDPPAQWTRMSRTWQNDPAAAARTSIDAFWGGGLDESSTPRGGFYASLGSANTALIAIRKNGVVINDESGTKRAETVAQFMQGASLMMFALQYDKAYVVDENSELTSLEYSTRKVVRDSAVSKLLQAAALAEANEFTTEGSWANGIEYSSDDIAKIAYTMAAMTLAYYPRDNSELNQVDWAKVAEYASKGMSTGTPTNFWFNQDGYVNWISELMNWFDGVDSGRIHTRVSHFMDPATQHDPWPDALGGNPRPNSADKRLGDGSYGDADVTDNFGVPAKTANGGTDFVWSATGQIFRPARGQYHQSNIGQVRYDFTGNLDPAGQYGGHGPAPAINAEQNDLIWAEALLRQGGATNVAKAVALINKTRVGRGGLPAATVGEAVGTDADGPCMTTNVLAKNGAACTLFSKLLYEKEVELIGLGPSPFWEQRRLPIITATAWESGNFGASPARVIQGLLPGTPREMQVPYKELGVKGEPLYTWGGATPNSSAP